VKRVLLIVVVAALALTLVPPAVAGASRSGGLKHGKAKFNFVGTVVAPAAGAPSGTLTIKVKAGTKTVRALVRREDATPIIVADEAKIRLVTEEGLVAIKLADVPIGAKVKARGTLVRDQSGAPVCTIKFLKVKAPAEPTTPPAAQ
jgi:hypothetical protein